MRALLLSTLVLGMLQAQDATLSAGYPPMIRVHGEATVSAQPDQAQLDIGVVTQAAAVKAAVAQNASQTNAVLGELRNLLSEKEIRTLNFSVNPNYRYSKEGASPTIDGYTANNTVRLTLSDLSKLPSVIDVATKYGANTLDSLNFSLKDEKTERAKALADAAKQAAAGAQALADSLQVKLGRLLQVEEGQPAVIVPVRPMMAMAKSTNAAATPVSSGTIDVHANVTLVYGIVQDQPSTAHQR